MEFYGIKNTLEELKNRKEIYLEEMAGAFLDLCRDVRRDTGIVAAKLPVEDAEEAALALCQMGQMYLAILNDQADVLMATEKKELLLQMEQKIQEQTRQLNDANAAISALEQKKKELAQKEKEAAIKEAQKEKLQKECEEIQRKIGEQAEIDVETWTGEKGRLEKQYEDQQEKIKQIQAEKEKLETQEADAKKQLSELTQQVNQKKKEVQDLKKKYKLRQEERTQLLQKESELTQKLENIDLEKENERIEEAQRYANVMMGAWNVASEQLMIHKKIHNLDELEREMSGKRQRIEEAVEIYRRRIGYVIHVLEEGLEEGGEE